MTLFGGGLAGTMDMDGECEDHHHDLDETCLGMVLMDGIV